jgi:hypothetical protein
LGFALADKGLIYENSIFSHWQNGTRIPSDRYVMLKLLEIFVEREAIQTLNNANEFLSSAGHGYLTEEEQDTLKLYYSTSEIDEKVKTAKNILEELPGILTTVNSSLSQFVNIDQFKIRYYKDRKTVSTIYQEALSARELRAFCNMESVHKALPENTSIFLEAFEKNKDLQITELFQDDVVDKKKEISKFLFEASKYKKYDYKLLPDQVKLCPTVDTLIYDGKISFINFRKDVFGIVLENEDNVSCIKGLFDFVYKVLNPDRKLTLKSL